MQYHICRCGKKIEYKTRMCEACSNKHKDIHRSYNKYGRDKDSQDFYNSKQWSVARDAVRTRDRGLCRLCYEEKKTIKGADVVHHIEEVKRDKSKRHSLDNLICLCNVCHREVHHLYKTKSSIIKEKLKDIIKENRF